MFRRALVLPFALSLALGLLPLAAGADTGDPGVTKTDNVTAVARFPGIGGSEIDFDGSRYLYAGQANLTDTLQRQNVAEGQHGGLRIIDSRNMQVVGELRCPGTDNYVRYLDPKVFNTAKGDREFVVVAFHGNVCTRDALDGDPNTRPGYGAFNGVMIVDVKNKRAPQIVSTIGHDSAHTVMPHPTRPYLYILPGGLANGTTVPTRISPTAIINVEDPHNPVYVRAFTHNAQGCHDLGFSHDGNYAFCAGLGEVQTWNIAGARIENPQVVGTLVNPAIQFAHNVVVSPSGRYMAINDEAFGFHTCNDNAAADLYGSLWIYDIAIPEVPVLAGRIAPPGHPGDQRVGTLYDVGPINGWADSWCAAHNYNWVPGNDDVIVASWFAGGVTAHDMSDPLNPKRIAHYMPHDGVAWSGHYYGGYIVTNDMVRGVEILDVPDVRAADPTYHPSRKPKSVNRPRTDNSALLIPAALPPRPTSLRNPQGTGFCVIPGGPLTT